MVKSSVTTGYQKAGIIRRKEAPKIIVSAEEASLQHISSIINGVISSAINNGERKSVWRKWRNIRK